MNHTDYIVEHNIKIDHGNDLIDIQLIIYSSNNNIYHLVKYPQPSVTFNLISGNKAHMKNISGLKYLYYSGATDIFIN